MSDIDVVMSAVPRIGYACRTRLVRDPGSGGELTAHQAGILQHLDRQEPVMVGELADHLGVTASTMSLTLKRLEARGFVERSRDPEDRRVMNVRLTDAGERVRAAETELDPERIYRMLGGLDAESRRLAIRGLGLLAEAADALVRGRRDSAARPTGG